MSFNADIKIEKPQDWSQFRQKNLDVIVDPMVFRSAEAFFRGKKGAGDIMPIGNSDDVWSALSSNIDSVGIFFDQIVFEDNLPLIDYESTFDPSRWYDTPWISETINRELDERVVFTVHVRGDVSQKAREAALDALPRYPTASPEQKKSVLDEMTAFDYQYRPNLGVLEGSLSENDLVLARFLYGGLMFNAFCQMSGSAHVLQPKRARLLTAMSLGLSSEFKHEQELAAELDRRIQANKEYQDVRLGSLPSVLPYLLLRSDPYDPRHLLFCAKSLRADPLIAEYRTFRNDLLHNWVDKGYIDPSHEKNLKRVALKLHRKLEIDKVLPVELGVGVKVEKGIAIGPTLKLPLPTDQILGWFLEQLPGSGRYMKVLTRLKDAQNQYSFLDRHLNTLWQAL